MVYGPVHQNLPIKNKPILEGYNFLVLTTSSGYVINFTPGGCTAAGRERRCKTRQSKFKMSSTVERFFITMNSNKVSFVLQWTSFFTLPSVSLMLHEEGIRFFGTSHFQKGS